MGKYWLGYILVASLFVCTVVGYLIFVRPRIKAGVGKFFVHNGKRLFGIVCIIPIVLFLLWYMSGDFAIADVVGLSFETGKRDFWAVVAIWASIFCGLATVFLCFFDARLLRLVNQFFVLPICIAVAVLFRYASYGIVGDQSLLPTYPYALYIGIVLALSVVHLLRFGFEKPNLKDCKYIWLPFAMLLAVVPPYFFQVVAGYKRLTNAPPILVSGFNQLHRLVLYGAIVIPILVYLLLKNKDIYAKKMVLLYMSFACLIAFSSQTNLDSTLQDLPLNLTSLAVYFVPLCLIFRLNKLFVFTFAIIAVASLLSLLVPVYSLDYGFADSKLWYFAIIRYNALYLPILMVALGLYQRPKYRQFGFSVLAFAGYFVFILAFNLLVGTATDTTLNFFNTITADLPNKFGAFGKLVYNIVIDFDVGGKAVSLHILYLVLYFVIFVLLAHLVFFATRICSQYIGDINQAIAESRQIKQEYNLFLSKIKQQNSEERESLNTQTQRDNISLTIDNLSKKYGRSKVYAVKNASLQVCGGQIFGFLGPNGAGKSTIIKSIVGIHPPTSGKIEICGYDVVHQDIQAKLSLGYVPDHYALYEKLTGREYINYIADIYRVDRQVRDTWVNQLVNRFELSSAYDNPMRTYSHGMKQKIAIIAAIVHKPKLWILDEPLTGLDPTSIWQVKETMREYAREGNIVFFSSHIIDVIEDLCQRIAIIKKGEIQGVWDIDAVLGGVEEHYLQIVGINKQEYKMQDVSITTEQLTKQEKKLKKKHGKNSLIDEKQQSSQFDLDNTTDRQEQKSQTFDSDDTSQDQVVVFKDSDKNKNLQYDSGDGQEIDLSSGGE